jgi:hypothetical protein
MSAVDFLGESFEISERVNERRMLRLMRLARSGADSDNADAMGEFDEMLSLCFASKDEEKRFDAACDRDGVTTEQLFEFVGKVIAARAERPTARPSDSSTGPSSTPKTSESRAVQLASERFPGRPDLQVLASRSA